MRSTSSAARHARLPSRVQSFNGRHSPNFAPVSGQTSFARGILAGKSVMLSQHSHQAAAANIINAATPPLVTHEHDSFDPQRHTLRCIRTRSDFKSNSSGLHAICT